MQKPYSDLESILEQCNRHNVSEYVEGIDGISLKFFQSITLPQTKSEEKKEKPRANLLDEAVKSV